MPDGRYEHARAPAERLAAVAVAVVRRVKGRSPTGDADHADFLAAFTPYLARELIEAKLEEARLFRHLQRVKELERELAHAKAATAAFAMR